jgi:hypothetical protein
MQFHLVDTPAGATPSPRSEDRASSDLSWGSLPRAELTHLVELLSDATNTPNECWFAVWDGYGQLYGTPTVAWTRSDARAHSARRFARRQRLPRRTGQGSAPAERQDGAVPAEVLGGPRVHLPARDYLLLRGPIASAVAVHDDLGNQSPNLWWPSDHAWCVSTEIDFAWTYIGGAREVVDRILADPHLEALPATVHDHFTFNSDVLNTSLNG